MRLRPPPGRVGRPWLLRRLEVARTASQVLDEKRRALLRERVRLEAHVSEARSVWEEAAREAADWLDRAVVLSGERRVNLARQHSRARAQIEVAWRNSLGAILPDEPTLEIAEGGGLVTVGGSAALPVAVIAHTRALAAAVRYASLQVAFDRLSAELATTTRRLQAIERRWIPGHEQALARLELALDESEREDVARTRWAVRRLEQAPRRRT